MSKTWKPSVARLLAFVLLLAFLVLPAEAQKGFVRVQGPSAGAASCSWASQGGSQVSFRARVLERDVVVLNNELATVAA